MGFDTVEYTKEDGIAYVTLDRPDVRNVLDRRMMDELEEVWNDFREGDDAHVAVVSGAGEDFCAGGDLGDEMDRITDMTNEEVRRRMHRSMGGLTRGEHIYKPLIAAIDGWCLGGGLEVALACDIRVAGEGARFGSFNIREGLPLADGGSVRLPLIVGLGNAMEMALTGKYVGAERAREMNLVNRVAPEGRQWPTPRSTRR